MASFVIVRPAFSPCSIFVMTPSSTMASMRSSFAGTVAWIVAISELPSRRAVSVISPRGFSFDAFSNAALIAERFEPTNSRVPLTTACGV